MTLDFTLHDWRLMERVVGLIGRLGCAYTRLDVRAERDRYRASLDLVGAPDAFERDRALVQVVRHLLAVEQRVPFEAVRGAQRWRPHRADA